MFKFNGVSYETMELAKSFRDTYIQEYELFAPSAYNLQPEVIYHIEAIYHRLSKEYDEYNIMECIFKYLKNYIKDDFMPIEECLPDGWYIGEIDGERMPILKKKSSIGDTDRAWYDWGSMNGRGPQLVHTPWSQVKNPVKLEL